MYIARLTHISETNSTESIPLDSEHYAHGRREAASYCKALQAIKTGLIYRYARPSFSCRIVHMQNSIMLSISLGTHDRPKAAQTTAFHMCSV